MDEFEAFKEGFFGTWTDDEQSDLQQAAQAGRDAAHSGNFDPDTHGVNEAWNYFYETR